MAYNAVAHEASDSGSNSSRRSTPASHYRVNDTLQVVTANADQGLTGLGAIIRSVTSASYETVEDDDYDAEPPVHEDIPLHVAPLNVPPLSVTPLNTAIARHSPLETPLQSPTPSIPLSHPTPDLQSIQGAYVGNVERLEESAMRLSASSTDIASEIRKMDMEQKRRSCSSASNSVIMRNEAFSPGAMSSPHGSSSRSTRQRSVSGASRLAQLAEPDDEERNRCLNGIFASPFPLAPAIAPPPQPRVYPQRNERYYHQCDGAGDEDGQVEATGEELQRSSSAASGDTFQQAQTLFNGFDGVHFTPLGNTGRQFALNRPPLASTPQSYKEPQTGEHMVYYPAPVPRMLNLPPKLSRHPITDREKRRTQLLTTIAAEDRKAADEVSQSGNDNANNIPKNKHQSVISPHLRASVFFDPPRTTLEVEVKQQSAVATLDSILDASAHAPVSAFTDHPFAGHAGSHVYGSSKRNTILKKSSRNSQFPMGQRQSTVKKEADGSVSSKSDSKSEEDSDPSDETGTGSEEHPGSEGDDEEEEDELDYVGPPNTLLAELVLRKHELAQRRRTALPLPSDTGRYGATLLELDARAQRQSDKRRNRPVTLAWDPRDAGDDEEVPLGVLYADRSAVEEENRPLGLLEKRAHEENEPLSSRRARLRGEPAVAKRPVSDFYAVTVAEPTRPEPEPEESDHEGETMAERLKRLKGENSSQSHFASELIAEIDTRAGVESRASLHTKEAEPEPVNEEETLAQRRSRLQKENAAAPKPKPRVRQSMIALPQVRPAPVARKSSHDVLQQFGRPQYGGHRMSMQPYPVQSSHGSYHAPMGQPMAQPYNYGMAYPAARPYSQVNTMPMNGMAYSMQNAYSPAMARQPVDPAQLDMVDRWRQSIR
ncbi:hypothetical protein N7495_003771 [Penicillium taxi]|uniref:uncharacterized protein n=1 Tax=Penicillium taxi TaxID=168475 RepID=UPI0025451063|nr:uncharacterized protein N7495_003771 [Penicillium taxi]KAJ5899027.1 hypothetical protein N7495_003771 [Penicillium taxi]